MMSKIRFIIVSVQVGSVHRRGPSIRHCGFTMQRIRGLGKNGPPGRDLRAISPFSSFPLIDRTSPMHPTKSRSRFTRLAKGTSRVTGRPAAFIAAVGVILAWLVTGPLFRFSDTWQLVINTGTTIITFLMVFLIQSTQNRDAEAVQVKLDELLRATVGAHNALLDLEELEERELDQIRAGYARLAEHARTDLQRGQTDSGVPEVA
jgi:low affinity Fe/Cu permease